MQALNWHFEVTSLSERWFGTVVDDELAALSLGWFDLAFVRPNDFDRFAGSHAPLTFRAAALALAEWIVHRASQPVRVAAAGVTGWE